MTDAVTQAREAVAGAHSLTCSRNDGRTLLCSCGGPSRPIAHLDAYAAALLAAERQRVVGIIESEKREHHHYCCVASTGLCECRAHEHNRALSQLAARLTGGE
jgi:hypothetical protein